MPTFRDRAHGALLGLALGDAYGRTLEFRKGPSVRVQPVSMSPSDCMWTDDTHMALYLGEAVVKVRHAFDPDAFGKAWGERLVAWLHDPLTPSTAPGNTCLAGARAFERAGDWRTSGVRQSKGCGAVMRIAPLPIAFGGDTLTEAARISAVATHAHPDAVASAEALCWLLRDVLEDGGLYGEQVLGIAARSRAAGHPAVVAQALEAAVRFAASKAQWLDEDAIPDGDGGWTSPSCMGLAVAACLRWHDLKEIIDKAARIDGDSDSVAAVAGMLVGARSPGDLPAAWVDAIPERRRIEALADALLAPPPSRGGLPVRTSASDPLRVAWVDEYRLGFCFSPGKRCHGKLSRCWWDRDLGIDLGALRQAGVTLIACMVEDKELVAMGIPDMVERAARKDIAVRKFPTRDLGAPTLEDAREIARSVRSLWYAEAGEGAVVVICRGGVGRSGTVAACVKIADGKTPEEALRLVRAKVPQAVETPAQEAFVRAFHMDDPPPDPIPWHRPDGVDVYAGVVVFAADVAFGADRVLLRRLDRHGYRYTFPRVRLEADAWSCRIVDAACDLAARYVAITKMAPVHGTWSGGASVAQYWRVVGTPRTPVALDDPAEIARAAFGRDPTPDDLAVVRRLEAAGLSMHAIGVTFPLSEDHEKLVRALADGLPLPEGEPAPMSLEWVRPEEVEARLSETTFAAGRARDLAVWAAARRMGGSKPLFDSVGWERVVEIDGPEGRRRLDAEAMRGDRAFVSLPWRACDGHERAGVWERTVREGGGRLRACFTCRHYRVSMMSHSVGGGWCWATRVEDDDRRGLVDDGLGLCPLYERSPVRAR